MLPLQLQQHAAERAQLRQRHIQLRCPYYAYLAGAYDYWDSPPAIATGGCTFTYVPVLGREAEAMTAANYSRLLKDGFVLEWQAAAIGDCAACSAGGVLLPLPRR